MLPCVDYSVFLFLSTCLIQFNIFSIHLPVFLMSERRWSCHWCSWSSSVGLWQDPDEMYELKSPSLTFNCDESSQRRIVCSGPESRADSFSYVVQTTSSMVPCAFFFGHIRREAISYKVDYHSLATWHCHSPSHVWKPCIPPVLHLRATVSTRLTWKEELRRLFHARLLIVVGSMIPITAPPPPWLR